VYHLTLTYKANLPKLSSRKSKFLSHHITHSEEFEKMMNEEFDVSQMNIIPYVHLADASMQDNSPADSQFPGIYTDTWWFWAMADTENGKRYEVLRALTKSTAFDFLLAECPKDIWADPKTVRFPGEKDLYFGMIMWSEDNGAQIVFPASLSTKHVLSISVGPKEYLWKEDDCVDIKLTPLPLNVTTIYVPGLPDDVGYTSSGCKVEGTIEGSKITGGYGGIDRMYSLPGVSSLVSKIAILEHYWFVWGSQIEDGRWESGNAMLGSGNFAIATFHREGEAPVVATNDDVKAKVKWATQGDKSQPHRATLSFGGHTFHFEGNYNAAAVGVSLGIAWLHGTVEHEGAPKPVNSWSTMEVIKVRATPRD